MKKLFTLGLALVVGATQAWATHIRAGEISVRRLSCSNLEFLITFTGYEDTDSPIQLGPGTLFFGDGTERVIDPPDIQIVDELVAPGVRMKQFGLLHTYQSAGTYVIRFQELNRNEGVLNMNNSVNTPFYVETVITIDPFLGCNNTPVFLVPPIDRGARGITFTHNPGAWDPDGDSLAFFLEVNKQDINTPVDNYQFPHLYDQGTFGSLAKTEAGNTPTTYSIDPFNGTLEWDAPYGEGEYNVAIKVEEYRKINGTYYLLGSVVRDMQIIVEVTDNEPPELIPPPDTCIEAGTVLNATIRGSDPDGDPIKIEAYGGIFDPSFVGTAQLSPDPPVFQSPPATAEFQWNTLCSHVRERPYEVQLRIQDDPGITSVSLSRFKTWRIQVVGPAPTGLDAQVNQLTSAQLTWDPYTCANAYRMQVFRRVDSFEFDPTGCNVGIPDEAGYELIAEVGIGESEFLDNNEGEGLAPGATYCYRLVAVFPQPEGGESYASQEVCVTIEAFAPVITEVSVEETDASNGEIRVSWLPPFDLDTVNFQYEVYRSTGLSGGTNRQRVATTSSLTFLDTGLDTQNNPYHYEIVALGETDQILDTSFVASSVYNDPIPKFQAIEVTWEANVPWSNRSQDYPTHYIYRNRSDAAQNNVNTFTLIDSVNANLQGFRYYDDGSFDGNALEETKEYCYYVVTQGTYGNPAITTYEPLINTSQIACAQPNDTVPPCPIAELEIGNPDGSNTCEATLANEACGFNDFSNLIRWNGASTPECDDEIAGYNIYYSRTGEPDTYELLAFTAASEFLHDNLSSFAGCYRISVVDRSGNVSELSEPFCRDNCPQYVLPDAFTINNDGINETLMALGTPYFLATGDNRCPRFVEEVHFKVFNRWGVKVFEYNTEDLVGTERSIYINWDGRNDQGIPLPEGVYYYRADVTFTTLNPKQTVRTMKGVVTVYRSGP